MSRPRKRSDDGFRDLNRDQSRVEIFINVENDCAGNRVENIDRSKVAIRLQQHFQWKRHVQQPDATRGIECLQPGCGRRALIQQRTGRRIFDSARGVISNFLNGGIKGLAPKNKEVCRYDAIA